MLTSLVKNQILFSYDKKGEGNNLVYELKMYELEIEFPREMDNEISPLLESEGIDTSVRRVRESSETPEIITLVVNTLAFIFNLYKWYMEKKKLKTGLTVKIITREGNVILLNGIPPTLDNLKSDPPVKIIIK